MLAEERYKKTVEIVNQRGSIRVSELSEIFTVTEETIRRDLAKLEKEGKLIRSHGGAVSADDNQPELSYLTREVMNVEEKKEIASESVNYISVNDRIFLDASTTAWYTAAAIPNMSITVITNSIKVVHELADKNKIEVICIGGNLSPSSLSFVGPLSEASIDCFFVDKAFISCKGIHMDRGISDSNQFQARLKQKVIQLSNEVYLMVDKSKFGVQALKKICSFDQLNHIITNKDLKNSYMDSLINIGTNIIVPQTKEI
ncbi:DeoR/GlpR family DNA-binding transcription regulator [Evansella sp. AB-P1]|uniref:DeoR/GlpR family DNA-binding transcription regulator n=1 Tax=Evansella sp. AB-P1 TaxID=3037653 RepID=UPI00241DB9DE|nr:DeoR/GlpR family DNA-binding transcription regulator [Evansella sp. AB-P1]MDG5787852.1 DeoR/GlpR family DNA-binding transcription regulator [Evansella sp. AB-P1]